jgi:hypothetical protein
VPEEMQIAAFEMLAGVRRTSLEFSGSLALPISRKSWASLATPQAFSG